MVVSHARYTLFYMTVHDINVHCSTILNSCSCKCHKMINKLQLRNQSVSCTAWALLFLHNFIIHQLFLLTHDLSMTKPITWLHIPQLKLENIREYSPIFKTAYVAKKDLKDRKHDSLHLGQKCAQSFVLGHYLFFEAHSFTWAMLLENCLLLGTDNVRAQISEHIFEPNGNYCLFMS